MVSGPWAPATGTGNWALASASVIPDVFHRESRAFLKQGHTNEGTEEKDTGFPLKTGGNDNWGNGVTRSCFSTNDRIFACRSSCFFCNSATRRFRLA